jgi:hypothetical protein
MLQLPASERLPRAILQRSPPGMLQIRVALLQSPRNLQQNRRYRLLPSRCGSSPSRYMQQFPGSGPPRRVYLQHGLGVLQQKSVGRPHGDESMLQTHRDLQHRRRSGPPRDGSRGPGAVDLQRRSGFLQHKPSDLQHLREGMLQISLELQQIHWWLQRNFRPGGAAACSQGRKPLEIGPEKFISPKGAQAILRHRMQSCLRPFGARECMGVGLGSRGLRPWLHAAAPPGRVQERTPSGRREARSRI